MIRFLSLALLFLLLGAAPAAADPVITPLILTATGVAAGTWAAAGIQLAVGIGLSLLGRAIKGQPGQAERPGIRTEVTLEGGTLPQTRLLGRTITAGTVVAPFYSNGESGDVPNAYRYKVIDLADHPIHALRALWVDDTPFNVANHLVGSLTSYAGATPNPANRPEWLDVSTNLWVRFFDGRQTAADALMVDRFGGHAERPWGADRIGVGVPYVRTIHRYDDDVVTGEPQLLFQVEGERLYDRRKDSTAGGSGTQRPANEATWAYTENPFVMIEAILRGLPLKDGTTWGLGVAAADLPAAMWTTAQDHCDDVVDGEPRYRAGIEVVMATAENGGTDPFDVIDELLRASAGAIADCGGTWACRAGPPGPPVAWITDEDIVVSRPQDFEPHRGITDVYNAVRALYANPEERWKAKEAPLRTDAAAQAQDGERLVATLDLSKTVFSGGQAQRLQNAYLKDARRMRRHTITLPPEFSGLMPLDVISWTSARNGYAAKLFEVAEVAVEPRTLAVTLSLREVDPADYDWSPSDLLPDAPSSGVPIVIVPEPLPGFAVQGVVLTDDAGNSRRPAIEVSWLPTITGQTSIMWETRVAATGAPGPTGSSTNVRKGLAYEDGVLPATTYELRARGNKTEWTSWATVTTPSVFLTGADIPELDPRLEEVLQNNADLLAELDRSFDQQIGDIAQAQGISALALFELRAELGARFAQTALDVWEVAEDARGITATLRTEIGGVFDRAAALIVQEAGFRVSADEAIAYTLTVVEAALTDAQGDLVAQAEAATLLEARVTQTETGLEAVAEERTVLTVFLGSAEDAATAAALRALLGDHEGREALRAQVADAREQLTAQVSEVSGALAQKTLELTAAFGGSLALADQQIRAVADGVSAEASARLALAATISTLSASFISEQTATATQFSAQASQITALQAVVGDAGSGLVAEVTETSLALATIEGHLEASYVLRVRAGDAEATFEMAAVDDADGGPATLMRMKADRFQFYGDWVEFFVDGVVITGSLIADGGITTPKINGRAVTIPAIGTFDSDIDITSTSTWRTLWAKTLPKVAGYGVLYRATIPFAGYGQGTLTLRVRRGASTVVGYYNQPTGEKGIGATLSIEDFDPDTSGGDVKYYFEVRKADAGGYGADLVIDRRCTFYLEETLR